MFSVLIILLHILQRLCTISCFNTHSSISKLKHSANNALELLTQMHIEVIPLLIVGHNTVKLCCLDALIDEMNHAQRTLTAAVHMTNTLETV